jgi:XTP/dITP diphosphohydrolase
MSKRLVLASNNAKKAAEMQALLAPLGIEVLPQSVFGVGEAEEPHPSFVENASPRPATPPPPPAFRRWPTTPACASKRSAARRGSSPPASPANPESDARNNALLLEKLAHLPEPAQRRAYFYSAVVLVRHADDPRPLIADGEWHGEILPAARGDGGFGYDPLFWSRAGADRRRAPGAQEHPQPPRRRLAPPARPPRRAPSDELQRPQR